MEIDEITLYELIEACCFAFERARQDSKEEHRKKCEYLDKYQAAMSELEAAKMEIERLNKLKGN